MATMFVWYYALLAWGLGGAWAMRTTRTWTAKHWCESVEESGWPFAYSKYENQSFENKGRVNSNKQDMRHQCTWWGVRSKCHRCEIIRCGGGEACNYQIHGVDWNGISRNLPTVSDAPWAVNGSFRYDFGSSNTSHVCLMVSGGSCTSPFGSDYSNCSVRCWGYGFRGTNAQPQWHLPASFYTYNASNPTATDVWFYPKKYPRLGNTSHGAPVYNPQGYAITVAGGNGAGFADGAAGTAKFNGPQGVAVDREGNVYVADTGNHRIRRIYPNGTVITVAGTGRAGHRDGPALQVRARPHAMRHLCHIFADELDALFSSCRPSSRAPRGWRCGTTTCTATGTWCSTCRTRRTTASGGSRG
jgi:hypothetical protein